MERIQVWYNDGDMLDDWTGYNVEESLEAWERLLMAELRRLWPSAECEIIRNRGVGGWCRSPEVDGANDSKDAGYVSVIVSEVYSDYDWLVAE